MQKEIDVMIKEYKELRFLCKQKIEEYYNRVSLYNSIINDLEKIKVYDKEKVSKK